MKADRNRKKLIVQGITCLVFVMFIFVLTVINIFAPKKDFSENENRSLAPAVNLKTGSQTTSSSATAGLKPSHPCAKTPARLKTTAFTSAAAAA